MVVSGTTKRRWNWVHELGYFSRGTLNPGYIYYRLGQHSQYERLKKLSSGPHFITTTDFRSFSEGICDVMIETHNQGREGSINLPLRSQVCRRSYLNLTGEGAFQKVLKDCRGILDRHQLMLEVCELNSVSKDDCINVGKAEPGNCFLGGLSNWLIAYSTYLVRFINSKRVKLPDENLRHSVVEKKKYFAEFTMEVEKTDAEVQAEGVCNQQLQNLTLMPDKVYAIYFAAATRNNGA